MPDPEPFSHILIESLEKSTVPAGELGLFVVVSSPHEEINVSIAGSINNIIMFDFIYDFVLFDITNLIFLHKLIMTKTVMYK